MDPAIEGAATGRLDLEATLVLVADTIVESLGFDVAVVNILEGAQTMLVAAVTGPQEVRDALLHKRQGVEGWRLLMEESEAWGSLRFLDHAKSVADPADIFTWVPDVDPVEGPDGWHPEDALFAPLIASDGGMLGMLSVDLPRSGRRPDLATRHALEALAVTAALAIEHARVGEENRRTSRRFQAVFDSSPVAIGLIGKERVWTAVNDAFCTFLGRSRDELVGCSPLEFTHPDDVGLTAAASDAVRSADPDVAGSVRPVEKRYLRPDGSTVWGRLHLAPLDTEGGQGDIIAQVEDITGRKLAEQRLVRQARTDTLTSLPNRAELMRRLQGALPQDTAQGLLTVVFFCDLDKLKTVNDLHGHAAGDAYLRGVAERLSASMRAGDVVGRIGGDEFVAVLSGIETPTEAVGLAGRLLERVREPLEVEGAVLHPSVSLGISMSSSPRTDADALLAQADTAMYRAKSEEPGSWRVYDPGMRNTSAGQLALRADLPEALAQGQFLLHYQPVVRLSDGATLLHEALLRWQHPRRGLLEPDDFLPVVLGSQHESAVTELVLLQACRDAAARPEGARRTSVNVSSTQVGRRDLPDVVRRVLATTGLAAADLLLEITDDRLLTRDDGPVRLAELHALGVGLALDDYGTGSSGPGYLLRFRTLSLLKLAPAFAAALGEDAVAAHLVASTLSLARACGMDLVVEGVETQEQADALRDLGVEQVQGHLFGEPAPL